MTRLHYLDALELAVARNEADRARARARALLRPGRRRSLLEVLRRRAGAR